MRFKIVPALERSGCCGWAIPSYVSHMLHIRWEPNLHFLLFFHFPFPVSCFNNQQWRLSIMFLKSMASKCYMNWVFNLSTHEWEEGKFPIFLNNFFYLWRWTMLKHSPLTQPLRKILDALHKSPKADKNSFRSTKNSGILLHFSHGYSSFILLICDKNVIHGWQHWNQQKWREIEKERTYAYFLASPSWIELHPRQRWSGRRSRRRREEHPPPSSPSHSPSPLHEIRG